jgi:hypothetical protein
LTKESCIDLTRPLKKNLFYIFLNRSIIFYRNLGIIAMINMLRTTNDPNEIISIVKLKSLKVDKLFSFLIDFSVPSINPVIVKSLSKII